MSMDWFAQVFVVCYAFLFGPALFACLDIGLLAYALVRLTRSKKVFSFPFVGAGVAIILGLAGVVWASFEQFCTVDESLGQVFGSIGCCAVPVVALILSIFRAARNNSDRLSRVEVVVLTPISICALFVIALWISAGFEILCPKANGA